MGLLLFSASDEKNKIALISHVSQFCRCSSRISRSLSLTRPLIIQMIYVNTFFSGYCCYGCWICLSLVGIFIIMSKNIRCLFLSFVPTHISIRVVTIKVFAMTRTMFKRINNKDGTFFYFIVFNNNDDNVMSTRKEDSWSIVCSLSVCVCFVFSSFFYSSLSRYVFSSQKKIK